MKFLLYIFIVMALLSWYGNHVADVMNGRVKEAARVLAK
jgi:hypothetical protein